MKSLRTFIIQVFILLVISCGPGSDKTAQKPVFRNVPVLSKAILPVDQGFSRYI